MFEENWSNISILSYIEEASRTNAFWLGNLIGYDPNGNKVLRFLSNMLEGIFQVTGTRTRMCSIKLCDKWNSFISTCYSLSCEPKDKSWKDIDAEKESFRNWMETRNTREDPEFFKFEMNKFTNDVFITTLDINKKKRLIVDGLHRANALTVACENGVKIPKVRILESYGDKINVIFPCDAHQL